MYLYLIISFILGMTLMTCVYEIYYCIRRKVIHGSQDAIEHR